MDAQEYLEKLKNQVQVIDDPVAKQGAIIITQLGLLVVELLTFKNYGMVSEIEAVCTDIFKQVKKIMNETDDTAH